MRSEAIRKLKAAMEDKGNHPAYHDEWVARLEHEWPTLFYAIWAVLEAKPE